VSGKKYQLLRQKLQTYKNRNYEIKRT
jgi:hypothetical protein